MRIANTNCESQRHLTSKKIFAKHEREKKRQYNNGIMNVEHGTFTPLVFYLNGGMAKECLKFHKFVAEKIANNYRYENFFNNQVQTFIPHSSCSSNVRERQSLLHNTFREPSSRWFGNCIWLHARLRFERESLFWEFD